MSEENPPKQLKRELSWFGSACMGLASVIGVGIFVSIGIAAGISGFAVIGALVVAGLLGACNSLNLAQLAVSHPVSGGIYEYGYKYLTPVLGFTGGWIYFLSKTAVAATAALGFAGYLLNTIGVNESGILVLVAEAAVLVVTLIALGGARRFKVTTIAVVSVTILSLLFLIIVGSFLCLVNGFENLTFASANYGNWLKNFLESVALMFVAYNGAARISMMGEEITEPRKNIPKAIVFTIVVTMLLYVGVAVVSLGSIGVEAFSAATTEQAAPLQVVASSFGIPGAANILAVGAITSMLSILLTIILGVSRILLAMGRRGDMPSFFAQLNNSGTTPYWAVLFLGMAIALLVLTGDVKVTWSFAAFGSMYRCFIVSLAALQLSQQQRLYPQWLSWLSLFSSLFLAFWVEWQIWLIGLGVIGVGVVWHVVIQRFNFAVRLEPKVSE
ncbi:MAG: amino acid permease [Symploca sp. SIO3C6]|uniref:Amino acid permease n=1 Tax=Symploca sp. SIO1C4 TaxID=2607765 RepID=A0A6B3N987_9CYAN|nr:amino acid permease [Symploca sp. SIO3C6]NER29659.1 amino acid permease [Symploca sp. SIO1C4]NET07493.1 amino acid permease [Symploca sp. SIO2B6]